MLKRNSHINVNGRFGTSCWVTLYSKKMPSCSKASKSTDKWNCEENIVQILALLSATYQTCYGSIAYKFLLQLAD